MAKNKTDQKSNYEYEYRKNYNDDWDIHRWYTQTFNAYEAMLTGQVWDSVSQSVDGSKITDSYATTLAKERADRVAAKLPEGETTPMGKADEGKAAFMDLIRQKWIYPNANAQHPFQIKLNMWQLYSSVYGFMPMFYDWNVATTGYVGPDCWLWNPRNFIPQQGRNSLEEMDYVTATSWVGKSYLEDKIENAKDSDGWDTDALKELMMRVEETSEKDSEKDTQVEHNRISQATKRGIQLATRYEAGKEGKWITFAPDHAYVKVRELKNPHKNGRIPFVIKYSQPLFDSFYGLGDFQRAKALQFARDGLTNFYFKGIKMNLIPPLVVNANGIMKHTIDYREGAVMMETIPNSIRRLETSTAGLNTYQAAQSNLTGSLLSLYGTQNASLPGAETLNPSQGKTPAAIEMFTAKEATRDGAERRHLEAAIEQLTDGFYSLIANIGTETIPVELFAEDIKEIQRSNLQDVMGLFDKKSQQKISKFSKNQTQSGGELKIDPKALKGVEYRFNISPNSTMKVNKEQQLEQLERLMASLAKMQNVIQEDPRIDVNWGALLDTYEQLTDIKGTADYIVLNDGPSKEELELQQQNEEMQGAIQNMQGQMQQLAEQNQSLQAPTVSLGGQQFEDPDIGAAAQELDSL